MSELTLIIGNKNYSSWSLRPWILARHLGLTFSEQLIPLNQNDSAARLRAANPTGRVPALRHGKLLVWDSLSICEYLCELARCGLPAEPAARAWARSVSAEMHAGFQALRQQWPMNTRAVGRHTSMTVALQKDLTRIEAIWTDCRHRYAAVGPWLFGDYSIADAMYAPIALRFRTYGARLTSAAQSYMATVVADEFMREWLSAAVAEPWTIDSEEVGL